MPRTKQAMVLWVATLAMATTTNAAARASARPLPCSGAEHRQFDFWLGEWEVRDAKGARLGANTITRTLGGCALLESWRGAKGLKGTSVNAYDAARKVWHQTWVDDQGGVLLLEGRFEGGRMVLEGRSPQAEGGEVRNRITWEKAPYGRVRQVWESSKDGGATWSVAFDGIYVRAGDGANAKGAR